MKKLILFGIVFSFLLAFNVTSFGTDTPYPNATNDYGAAELWNFDGDSNDSSIGKTDGTTVGCSYSVDTPFTSGKSLYCDGTDDNYFNTNWFNFSSQDAFTVIFWLKTPNVADDEAILGSYDAESEAWAYLYHESSVGNRGAMGFVGDGAGKNDGNTWNESARTLIFDGHWKMGVFIHEQGSGGDKVLLYHNGSNQIGVTTEFNEGIADNPASIPFYFCARNNQGTDGSWMECYIDDVMIYNYVVPNSTLDTIYLGNYSGTIPTITYVNCISGPESDNSEPYTTYDTTPTFNITTDIEAWCRIRDVNETYSTMGESRNCSSTGSTNHICTLHPDDELIYSTDYVYISCATSYSGAAPNSTVNLTMNITDLDTNTSGAIDIGITSSDIGPSPTKYEDQQVYLRHLNGTQLLATVDRVAVYDSKRWLLNYATSGNLLGLFNITPAVYVLDMRDIPMYTITNRVSALINATDS